MTTHIPSLDEELLALFYRHDPVALRGPGMPEDEYRPEVEAILAHLGATHSVGDVRRLIYGIMQAYFAPLDAHVGPEERYDALAQDVWDAWCRHSNPEP